MRAKRGRRGGGGPGWRAKLGLPCLGLALALVLAEVGLRTFGPRFPLLASLTSIATFQTYHPIYGFFHRPGANGWIRTPEFTSFVQINSRGLRDREIDQAKPRGTTRILLLGDSVVEGAQVSLDQTFAKRLEATLRSVGGTAVEVINAGNAGFGTAQETLFLENDGRQYSPDVVMLVFFVDNDVADNGYAIARERKLDVTRRPFFVPNGSGGIRQLSIVAPPPDSLERLKTTLRATSYAFNAVENVITWGEARDQENQQIGKNRPSYLIDPPAEWQEGWQVTELLLSRARDSAEAMGARFVLVVAPAHYQILDDLWSWLLSGDTREGAARRYDREAANRRVGDIARRQRIALVDLLPTIRSAAAGAALYFPDDGHWTPAGHAVAAQALATYIEANRLLPSR